MKKASLTLGESVVEEFVDADYLKGEYIAVRTDGHEFYLAEVLLFRFAYFFDQTRFLSLEYKEFWK